ncbi:MAG: NADH-quinone oxidoreductase subunit N [Acidobacteria bacterium]|nr:NADH-quinone oxidoreductase subunit N [Acidobacteriota bacterium]
MTAFAAARDMVAIVPMLIVSLSAIAAMFAEAFRQRGERMPIGGLGIVGLIGALVASVLLWNHDTAAFGVVRSDKFALFVDITLCLVGILTIVFSSEVIDREELPAGEYYALTLFAIAGMMLMASATDLLVIFLALEVFSLAVYVLTALRRSSAMSAEAGFKYFLLGAFSSAFFLYGIAFTYAISGSTRLDRIGSTLAAQAASESMLAILALGLLLVGFAFKVSAVPFHMWTPDAYEGAPTIVTGFMSTGVKAAAFAAFVRVFLSAFEPLRGEWMPALWIVATLTMIVGTFLGVVQANVKRMLAYSSIAHAGYLLIGLVAGSGTGKSAILFYLLTYAISNLGAFGVIALMATRDRSNDDVRDFAGLWYTRPALAGLMTVFLLSLGGFPPTAGFIAKWYIFSAAVEGDFYWLAIIGVLTSVVSVFFYLRIVVMMYMAEGPAQPVVPMPSHSALAALGLAVAGIFYLGVLPATVLALVASSVSTIF